MTDQERSQAGEPEVRPEAEVPPVETEAEAEAAAGGEEVDGAAAELAALQGELEALNDRHLRLAAEFDNYRKRIERERAELWTRAQAELVKRLLEVLDDLQRVSELDAESATAQSLLEGARLVEKKMRHVLESGGLEPIEAQGEFFNPETMEALLTVPAEHPEEDEVVVQVFQKGYRFKGHLIRPARVQVKKYES
ncbi:MAG TPA: nucleotide exchange factor GrpE [Longimicrobiales bacterium]